MRVLPEERFANMGFALELLRKRRGWSQGDLARRAGMGKGQVSKYESGRELPKLSSLGRLLGVLDIQADGFFGIVAVVDRLEKDGAAGIPGTTSRAIDQALGNVYQSLLELQRAVLEFLLRPRDQDGA